MPADTCGAKSGALVCDRAPHDDGDHRGYDEERDAVLFWPTEDRILLELEHRIDVALSRIADAGRRAAAGERLRRAIADTLEAAGRA